MGHYALRSPSPKLALTCSVVQSQKAVTAYFSSDHIGFADNVVSSVMQSMTDIYGYVGLWRCW